MKTILVFSHIHNSFDKKILLEEQGQNPYINLSSKTVDEFIKDSEIKDFFMNKIDNLLENYQPGRPENKPDVLKQMKEITDRRQKMMEEHQNQLMIQQQQHMQGINPQIIQQYESRFTVQQNLIQTLIKENLELKERLKNLENKNK